MQMKKISILMLAILGMVVLSACSSLQPKDISQEQGQEEAIDFSNYPAKPSPFVRVPGKDVLFDTDYVKVTIRFPLKRQLYCQEVASTTFSMSPIIQNSTNLCFFKPNSPDEIHIGDIVQYKNINQIGMKKPIVIHRVVRKDGSNFTLIGDNVPQQEHNQDTIPFSEVEGVAFAIIY